MEDLCLHKMAVGLYARLQKECDAHIGALMQGLADSEASEPAVFLHQVVCRLPIPEPLISYPLSPK